MKLTFPPLNLALLCTGNLGDWASAPGRYFEGIECRCLTQIGAGDVAKSQPLLIGGGGILNLEILERLAAARQGRGIVIWGAGQNLHGGRRAMWPHWLRGLSAAGVRDDCTSWVWAPCVSCLWPGLRELRARRPRYRAAIYEHTKRPFPEVVTRGVDGPRLRNHLGGGGRQGRTWAEAVMRQHVQAILETIAGAEVLVTNSYHGCYWGALLGRRVIFCGPRWSTKFLTMRHLPTWCESGRWELALRGARVHETALEECQAATLGFAARAGETLGISLCPRSFPP